MGVACASTTVNCVVALSSNSPPPQLLHTKSIYTPGLASAGIVISAMNEGVLLFVVHRAGPLSPPQRTAALKPGVKSLVVTVADEPAGPEVGFTLAVYASGAARVEALTPS